MVMIATGREAGTMGSINCSQIREVSGDYEVNVQRVSTWASGFKSVGDRVNCPRYGGYRDSRENRMFHE